MYIHFFKKKKKRMLNQTQMCWHQHQPPTTQKVEV